MNDLARRARGPVAGLVAVSAVLRLLAPGVAHAVVAAENAVILLLAVVAVAVSAVRRDARLRPSRVLFAASLALVVLDEGVSAAARAWPSIRPAVPVLDVVGLGWAPLALAALLLLPTERDHRGVRLRAALDGVIGGAGLLLSGWLAVLEPAFHANRTDDLHSGCAVAFAVGDVVVAFAAVTVAAHVRLDLRRPLRLLTAGLLLVTAADAVGAVRVARGQPGAAWGDVLLQAGLVLVVWSALGGDRRTLGEPGRGDALAAALLPYLPVVSVMAVGLHATWTGHPIDAEESVMAAVMIGGLLGRQVHYVLELRSAAARLATDASTDALTGLANRAAFLRALDGLLADAAEDTVAVALLDLDGFKEVNDGFGHEAGDRALRAFAERLRRWAGTSAIVARLGGDEFGLAIADEAAEQLALAIVGHVCTAMPFQEGALDVPIAASAGVAGNRAGDRTSDLLRRADLAMYDAKRSPGARTAAFTDDMARRADRRQLLAQALAGAADRGELVLAYQPLFRFDDGKLAGAEALLRWTSPAYGAVSPAEFVPLAEETGAITGIGEWVLATALDQLAAWRAAGLGLPRLFVNVSARQFTAAFADTVLELVDTHGVERGVLTLEVTESAVPGLQANEALDRLRAAGVRLAMDDFGAGFSSLAQLARLPVDTLKIDREFIEGLQTDNGEHILRAVVALADDLGLTTVAEGIERAEQAQVLRGAGCTLAQGYLFARPMPAAELTGLLRPEDVTKAARTA